MNQRIAGLERINNDLERRLEEQAKYTLAVEKRMTELEMKWKEKNDMLLKETEEIRERFQQQQKKNEKLRDVLAR